MSKDLNSMTLVGRAGTQPQLSSGGTGDRVSFRMVATERWFDKKAGDWVDGDDLWISVVCWRALANPVLTGVRKGDPIMVIGRITTRQYEKNGATQYFTELRADFVGLDISRAQSRFTRNLSDSRSAADNQDDAADGPNGTAGGAHSAGDGNGMTQNDRGEPDQPPFDDPWNAEDPGGNLDARPLVPID